MTKNIVFVFLLLLSACSTLNKSNEAFSSKKKLKILRHELKLTKAEYKSLKNIDTIINEAYRAYKDTVNIASINKRLDSFFEKKYTKMELVATLGLERIQKHTFMVFELDRSKDSSINHESISLEDLKKFLINVENSFKTSGFETITDTSITNAIREKMPDSLRLIKLKKYIKERDSLTKRKKIKGAN